MSVCGLMLDTAFCDDTMNGLFWDNTPMEADGCHRDILS